MRISVFTAAILVAIPAEGAPTVFFSEDFDDTKFAARGWYDGSGGEIDGANHAPGSAVSFDCHWASGGTTCEGRTPHRHLFAATPTIYVTFWMKFGSATAPWQGSGVGYHPHIIQLLTDADSDYVGPNSAVFSALIETHLHTPRIAEADSAAINTSYLGTDLLASAMPHALAGGNGSQNASASYYDCGGGDYCNSTYWDAPAAVFVNDRWHYVEFYAAMNSTSNGVANRDGILRYRVDGNTVIDARNVYLRGGDHPNRKFRQLLLAPYIGDGSPIAQDLWIDQLVVSDMPDGLGPAMDAGVPGSDGGGARPDAGVPRSDGGLAVDAGRNRDGGVGGGGPEPPPTNGPTIEGATGCTCTAFGKGPRETAGFKWWVLAAVGIGLRRTRRRL